MEVKFETNNATIWLRDGNLWMVMFHSKDYWKKIIVADVIEDVKAVVRLFLDVEEIPEIDVEKCDELVLNIHGFTRWVLETRNNDDIKKYTIKKLI